MTIPSKTLAILMMVFSAVLLCVVGFAPELWAWIGGSVALVAIIVTAILYENRRMRQTTGPRQYPNTGLSVLKVCLTVAVVALRGTGYALYISPVLIAVFLAVTWVELRSATGEQTQRGRTV